MKIGAEIITSFCSFYVSLDLRFIQANKTAVLLLCRKAEGKENIHINIKVIFTILIKIKKIKKKNRPELEEAKQNARDFSHAFKSKSHHTLNKYRKSLTLLDQNVIIIKNKKKIIQQKDKFSISRRYSLTCDRPHRVCI